VGRDNYGTIQTGDQARTVSVPPEAFQPIADVEAPPGTDNLPFRPHLFVGRGTELHRLDEAMAQPGHLVIQAVSGLGGVGKSTLAAHWAANHAHSLGLSPVRWITADSKDNIRQGLADFACALQPVLAETLAVEQLAERALQWLATHTGWLVILDNVNDPADIAPLLARPTDGRFLITSRLATGWGGASVLPLDILTPAEALDLLSRTMNHEGRRDMAGAAQLCAELGYLPLAVEQAGSYLAENPLISPRDYLELLAQYPADMYQYGGATTPAERTIASIWRLTLDRITALEPAAGDVLRTLAWYAPDHIHRDLVAACGSPPAVNRAIGLLAAYSMITLDTGTQTAAVHRLVQTLARTADRADPHRDPLLIEQARHRATDHLAAKLPDRAQDPAQWPLYVALLPHAEALAENSNAEADTANTIEVLGDVSAFLVDQGMIDRAIPLFHRVLSTCHRLLGPDNHKTLMARNQLAWAHHSAGEYHRAIALHQENLNDMGRVLGADHPHTLAARSNLAYGHQGAGNLQQAVTLFEESLAETERALGATHIETATAQHNLAHACQLAGDTDRAISLSKKALVTRERVLGSGHRETLAARNSLGNALCAAGDFTRATALHRKNLNDTERLLGPEHPQTLAARNNLAVDYKAAEDYDRAIALLTQNLAAAERVWGDDHPDTLGILNNLAATYEGSGDYKQAVSLCGENLARTQRSRGPHHPETLMRRSTLASALRESGDLRNALTHFQRLLDEHEQILGRDDPRTMDTRNDVAATHYLAKDYAPAIRLYKENFSERERVLGPEHPMTLAAQNNLASAYWGAGNPGRALVLCIQNLADTERILGSDHPQTLGSRNNLATSYQAAGQHDKALPLYRRNLEDSERILGPHHSTTVLARDNLADALTELAQMRPLGPLGRAITP
jgi:tetratricopeptide (TPR) repeat protein